MKYKSFFYFFEISKFLIAILNLEFLLGNYVNISVAISIFSLITSCILIFNLVGILRLILNLFLVIILTKIWSIASNIPFDIYRYITFLALSVSLIAAVILAIKIDEQKVLSSRGVNE